MNESSGLYLMHISLHGLIRGQNMELGRDPDTGGQTRYVVDLARALAADSRVDRMELVTRRVVDVGVDSDYSEREEELDGGARIVRVPFGPRRYLRKESLWPYIENFVDAALAHIRRVGRVPDVIHGHYADAGLAGARLAGLLGVPFVFTGHSLGRVKRRRLAAEGLSKEVIADRYNIWARIEGEEIALDSAELVVASTNQERDQQYALYDNQVPGRTIVNPPGVPVEEFFPPQRGFRAPTIEAELRRFLSHPSRPLILAIARADRRKNLVGLVRAYAGNPELVRHANLAIFAGNRDDIGDLPAETRAVLKELLMAVDRHDLYGHVALPKKHRSEDVPDIYRTACRTRGLFVNVALTEPFGLTLIEAAASGLPIVATNDGGPRDIVSACRNGVLGDPLDGEAIGRELLAALSDRQRWRRWSHSGRRNARRKYAWSTHVDRYLKAIGGLDGRRRRRRGDAPTRTRLAVTDRALITDIDNTLVGDEESMRELLELLTSHRAAVGWGVASGRRIESVAAVLEEHRISFPDVIISSVGSEIHYGPRLVGDEGWRRHIDYRWKRKAIVDALGTMLGLKPQPDRAQRAHKISYYVDDPAFPGLREVKRRLRRGQLHANVIFSHHRYLDVLPVRASKGLAVRYVSYRWGIPIERILVAGDSGNDAEMLRGATLGVVVANYSRELRRLRGVPGVYFASDPYARGILDGIEHYEFFGGCREEPTNNEEAPQ